MLINGVDYHTRESESESERKLDRLQDIACLLTTPPNFILLRLILWRQVLCEVAGHTNIYSSEVQDCNKVYNFFHFLLLHCCGFWLAS